MCLCGCSLLFVSLWLVAGENAAAAGKAGAIDAVVAVMKKHNDASVMVEACAALSTICLNCALA